MEKISICGNVYLIAVGAAETVREILERILPVRARLDRKKQKSIAGDEGGTRDY